MNIKKTTHDIAENFMPKDNLNKNSGFVTELKAKIEQQIKEQQAETIKKTGGTSAPSYQ